MTATPSPPALWLGILAVDSARYFVTAGFAFLVFWVLGRERFAPRLIQGAYPRVAKLWHDVRWSLSTIAIFASVGTFTFFGAKAGIFRRYEHLDEHGWAWLALSVLALIVLQDTYFYWTHRAMHHRRLYKLFHLVHHRSTNPSPWTAYAFAPLEALTHAAFVPLVWLVLPLHEAAVFVFLLFMIVRNVHGHLSMELFRPGFTRGAITGWLTTTTHHNLHHQRFTTNYGLYFTLWDRLLRTTDARYHATFERVAAAPLADPLELGPEATPGR